MLIRRNDKPVAWIVSAEQLRRAAQHASPDDPTFADRVLEIVAVNMFDQELLSLGQAARLSGMAIGDFIDLASRLGVAILRETAGGIATEVDKFDRWLQAHSAGV
ncbi:MAG TPA: UPF0175 family protein [Chloroflexota bacterium]|nr:UPF0175 family protein [Chloroflexota bacterium]